MRRIMSIEQKKKTIDGTTYKVDQMNAIRGLQVQTKLIKLLGPSVGKVLAGGKVERKAILDTAVGYLIGNFDDNEVTNFVVSLFDKGVYFVEKDGEDYIVDFNLHFTGKPLTIWKVVSFILEANFGDLLGKITGGSPLLQKIVSGSEKES